MANPNFTPETSTNQIYRDIDDNRCLTDDLDNIEADIEDLQDNKADANHTHTGFATASHTHNYAPTAHTHNQADVAGLETALAGKADAAHTHDYAASGHTHTASEVGAASASHTHGQSEVTGLSTALAGKANASHTHAQADVTGLGTALAAKADLVDGKVPTSQLPSFVDDVVEYSALSAFPATGEAGKIYVATGTNKTYRWSGSAYVEISASIALGETSATAYRGDRGKVAYDHSQNGDVHVTAAQKSAWDAKQNALSFDTTPTANSTNPVTSGGVKSALDGKANASHTHNYAAATHGHAQSEITGLTSALEGKAAASHSHSYNDLSDKPTIPTIPASLPANGGNADTVDGKHASDFATASHTHTAASIGAAASSHNHDAAYVPFDLFGFNTTGGVEYSYGSGSGKNVLTEISNMPQGLHTIYAIAGTAGNPETTDSYRYFIHKTSGTIGWIWAFGADGSIYSNYQSAAGTFKGWRTIHDTKRKPLWTGSYYMTAGHTATPSKKLSQCEHGWMLLWSDYDPDTNTVNNSDFATTIIPNRNWAGGTWNGASFYCDVPRYSAGTATDSESRVIKLVTVYDNKIVGTDANNAAPRNDVVLRAIYEF